MGDNLKQRETAVSKIDSLGLGKVISCFQEGYPLLDFWSLEVEFRWFVLLDVSGTFCGRGLMMYRRRERTKRSQVGCMERRSSICLKHGLKQLGLDCNN